MSRTGRWSTGATVGLILLVVGVAAAIVLALSIPAGAPLHPGGSSASTGPVLGANLGERIFQTGTDESGRIIPRSGAMRMMGSVVACADCHGPDARGRTIQVMMGQADAPDIRWRGLGTQRIEEAVRRVLPRARIELIGKLPDYEIPSGFRITPVVGWIEPPFDLRPDPFEVAEIFEAPLGYFLDPGNYQRRQYDFRGRHRHYMAIPYEGHYIWGATAGMLYSLYRMLSE